MDADRDYYQILLIVPDAPAAMIEASYRTLKQRLRAKPGSVAAEALLDEAYRVLSNPEQRAAYDLERDVALSERSAADFAATDGARSGRRALRRASLSLLRDRARARSRARA